MKDQGLLDGVFVKVLENISDLRVLLSTGDIEKALQVMQREWPEANELLGQLKFATKENLGGRLDFKEFEKVRNRVAAAALELL